MGARYGRLRVTVVRARNLPGDKPPTVLVVLTVGDQKQITAQKKKNNPEWEETREFDVLLRQSGKLGHYYPDSPLQIEVVHLGKLKKSELVGRGWVPLKSIYRGETQPHIVNLQGSALVELTVTAVDWGMDPHQDMGGVGYKSFSPGRSSRPSSGSGRRKRRRDRYGDQYGGGHGGHGSHGHSHSQYPPMDMMGGGGYGGGYGGQPAYPHQPYPDYGYPNDGRYSSPPPQGYYPSPPPRPESPMMGGQYNPYPPMPPPRANSPPPPLLSPSNSFGQHPQWGGGYGAPPMPSHQMSPMSAETANAVSHVAEAAIHAAEGVRATLGGGGFPPNPQIPQYQMQPTMGPMAPMAPMGTPCPPFCPTPPRSPSPTLGGGGFSPISGFSTPDSPNALETLLSSARGGGDLTNDLSRLQKQQQELESAARELAQAQKMKQMQQDRAELIAREAEHKAIEQERRELESRLDDLRGREKLLHRSMAEQEAKVQIQQEMANGGGALTHLHGGGGGGGGHIPYTHGHGHREGAAHVNPQPQSVTTTRRSTSRRSVDIFPMD